MAVESRALSTLLRRHRKLAGLTQEVLAERAGLSVRTVSDLERGVNATPRKDTLDLLIEALQLPLEERAVVEEAAHRPSRSRQPDVAPRGAGHGGGLRVELLGGFGIEINGRAADMQSWRSRKGRALIKLLALAPDHRLHRDEAIELLWPEIEPDAGVNNLHQVVHGVRRVLRPPALLQMQAQVLSLDVAETDVERFQAAAARARQDEDAESYRSALALYAGDLLPDDLYEEWCHQRREGLQQLRLGLLLDLGRLYESRLEHDAAIEVYNQALAVDAALEEAHAGLMRAFACTGRGQLALRQYQTLWAALQAELAAEPGPESRRVHQEILAGRLPLQSQDQRPARNVSTRPQDPVSGSDSSAGGMGALLHNLPVLTSSFVGRVHEQGQVSDLLTTTRLLTLTGPGGCGKTRLAIRVATDLLERFPDGVYLVDLAPVRQPSLVAQSVTTALDLPEQPDRPLAETLIAHLQSSSTLLLLDNCEHLISACSSLAEMLLRRCPQLRILATSREPLHVPGEVTWQVRSLSLADPRRLPPLEDLFQYEAIQLFVDRARERQPMFTLSSENAPALARICHRLDGMPLALELAAARVNVLALEQIEQRLDDCFRLLTGGNRTASGRQQTLQATLDWSYDLLSSPEQALFQRLAVFAGSFGLEAAETVGTGEGIESVDVLDLLTQLVDKSLLRTRLAGEAGEVRYRLLEVVRQYAWSRLQAAGEEVAVRQRHRDHYLRVAEQANAGLWTERQDRSLQVLEMEQDNLRAALTSYGDAEAGGMLSRALWQFWLLRGHFTEGRNWLMEALDTAPGGTPIRAQLLRLASAVRARQGDLEAARALAEESLAISRAKHVRRGCVEALHLSATVALLRFDYRTARREIEAGLALVGDASADRALLMNSLGVVRCFQGDYRTARVLMEKSLRAFRDLGDQPRIASLFLSLAWTVRDGFPYGHAAMRTEDTWALFREIGTNTATGHVLANLGSLARIEEQHDPARQYLEDSLSVFRALGDRAGIALVVAQLGNLATSAGEYERASALLEESLALRRAMGDRRGMGRTLTALGNLACAEGNPQRANALYEEAMALFEAMGDRPGRAWLLNDLVYLAMSEGDYRQAEALNEQAAAVFVEIGANGKGRALSLANLGILAQLKGDIGKARSSFEASLRLFREREDRRTVAALLRTLGEIAQAEGDQVSRDRMFAESAHHLESLGDDGAAATLVAESAAAG